MVCVISVGVMRMEFFFQAVEGILDGLPSMANDPELMVRHRDIHLRVLKALQDPRAYGMQWTNKQVTRCVSWHLTHLECSGDCIYQLC
jgi:CCR4-NOT transcription complex subunit 1